jgi:hypothetical protein
MASTYSDRLKLELQGTGENAGTWGDKTNNNLDVVDAFVAGYLSKNVGGSSNVTLTTANASSTAESSNKVIELTGTLTGNITVFIPAKENNYFIYNNTAGSFTVNVAATGHGANSATIAQGAKTLVYCTSDNVEELFGDDINVTGNVTATSFIGDGSSLTNIEPFPAGTSMLFQQTAAPTGWTKQTTHDNKALRLVTGSVSSSGSNSFTSVFNSSVAVSGTSNNSTVTISGSTASHTLTIAQMPSHDHREGSNSEFGTTSSTYTGATRNTGNAEDGRNFQTETTGGGQGHSHGSGTLAGDNHSHTYTSNLNLDVQYVDFIIANKD